MLFKVTTYNTQVLNRVIDGQSYSFALPAGTYVFRRVPHPYIDGWKDWLVLDQPHLAIPELESMATVGMDYESFMFFSKPSIGGYASMYMSIEEIVSIKEFAEQTIEVLDAKPIKLTRRVIQLPTRPYPSFVRHDPPRGSSVSRSSWNRVMEFHPAARRVCA